MGHCSSKINHEPTNSTVGENAGGAEVAELDQRQRRPHQHIARSHIAMHHVVAIQVRQCARNLTITWHINNIKVLSTQEFYF